MKGKQAKIVFIFAAVFCAFLVYTAYANFNASDLLGQMDDSGNILYTRSDANNLQPNSRGLSGPNAVATDTTNHRLFVVDYLNNRVLVFNLDASNNLIDRVADYVLGQPDFTSNTANNGGRNAATMSSPVNAIFDPVHNRLFVADASNNRILVFDLSTIATGMNASYVLGQPDFTTATVAITQNGMWTSNSTTGISYDETNDRLFLAEYRTNRVLVFNVAPGTIANGMNASFVLGQTSFTSSTTATTQSGISGPGAVAYDATHTRLFTGEYNNQRVLVYDVATSTIANGMDASYVLGKPDFTTATGGTSATSTKNITGLKYDADNDRLFVADYTNNRILAFNVASGTLANGMSASYVLGQATFGSSTAATTQSGLSLPVELAYDSGNKRLYVTDYTNNRIIAFNVDPATIANGANAVDALGQLDGSDNPVYTTANAQNTVAPNNKGLKTPTDIAIDSTHHRLFVADYGNSRVLVYNLDADNNLIDRTADYVLGQPDFNTSTTTITQSGGGSSVSVAYDATNNRLFVPEYSGNRVLVFDVSTITNGMNASYVLGQPNFTSSTASTTQSGTSGPYGVSYDDTYHRLFVGTDVTNNRVLVYDLSSGITNGMNASYVFGQPNFTSSTASTTASGLSGEVAPLYDGTHGRLFIADAGNNRVLVYNVTSTITNGMAASYVLGQTSFTSSVSARTQSGLSDPTSLAYDSASDLLYVGQYTNGRVSVFDVSSITNGENAIAVIGASSFTTSGAATTQGGTNRPYGLALDATRHRLYVVNYNSNRVTIYDLPTITSASLPSTATGDEYYQTINTSSTQGTTVSLSITSGTLPAGLFTEGSHFSGGPTSAGTYTFSLRAEDNNGAIGSFYSLPVSYTITVTSSTSRSASVGNSYGSQTGTGTPAWVSAPVPSEPVAIPSPAASTPPAAPKELAPLYARISELKAQVALLTSSVTSQTSFPSTPSAPFSPLTIAALSSPLSSSSIPVSSYFFPRTLRIEDEGEDVKQLQIYLNTHGFIIAPDGPGSPGNETERYGAATYDAISRFQEAYERELLVPLGLTKGYGYFGPSTRKYVNGG